jgi:hypothetical protein
MKNLFKKHADLPITFEFRQLDRSYGLTSAEGDARTKVRNYVLENAKLIAEYVILRSSGMYCHEIDGIAFIVTRSCTYGGGYNLMAEAYVIELDITRDFGTRMRVLAWEKEESERAGFPVFYIQRKRLGLEDIKTVFPSQLGGREA